VVQYRAKSLSFGQRQTYFAPIFYGGGAGYRPRVRTTYYIKRLSL